MNSGSKKLLEQFPGLRDQTGFKLENSGGSWEPSSKKEFELQQNFEENSQTFCEKELFWHKSCIGLQILESFL